MDNITIFKTSTEYIGKHEDSVNGYLSTLSITQDRSVETRIVQGFGIGNKAYGVPEIITIITTSEV